MHTLYTSSGCPRSPGTTEEEDDYENSAPSYKDLPPKPGWMASPRPPKAGKNSENPSKPQKMMTALEMPPVTCRAPPAGVALDPPVQQPLLDGRLAWLLGLTSLLLSCIALAATLIEYQEVNEAVRTLSFQQKAWQATVSGTAGLAGLKEDIDQLRADMNHSLVELGSLLGHTRVTCPDGWLLFENKCYYFSPSTKSWDEARIFCQENYSHLVIIDSFEEHQFVAKAHGSPRVYWLGLNDKKREGDWRWLDGSPVTLSFWDPQEPNNFLEEDCGSMNKGGTWNDLSCTKTTYWICERKCSC